MEAALGAHPVAPLKPLQSDGICLLRALDRRPDEIEKKKTTREDANQAAAETVREVTEGR